MDPLRTETAAMQTEAGNFDRIAGELTTVLEPGRHDSGRVGRHDARCGRCGSAGGATRFEEASTQQIRTCSRRFRRTCSRAESNTTRPISISAKIWPTQMQI